MNINFSALKELISEAKGNAKVKASKQYSVVRSRGNELAADVGMADSVTEAFGTKRELTTTFDHVMRNHDVVEVYIQGGFDGADSVVDMNNLYDPLVEEWALKIWDKEHGHYTYEMIAAQLEEN